MNLVYYFGMTSTKNMRVMFISFQDNTDVIGVKYLHAYTTSKGYDSSVLLLPSSKPANVKLAINYIITRKPHVLCFSIMSHEFQRAKDFVNALRGHSCNSFIIFGGIHPTALPESCLEISDIVVLGEGEETLLELLRFLDTGELDKFAQVKGIVFKQGNRIIHTPARGPIRDIDMLPYPGHLPESIHITHRESIRSVMEPAIYKKYARYQGTFLSVISSRGCPFSCHYCCNSVLKSLYGKTTVRNRAPEYVIDEIVREVRNFGNILYVNFQDDCFMAHSMEWITKFTEQYLREVAIPFVVRTTPKHINREKLALLKSAGLRWIFMGLQSGSDRINREIYGRNVTSEEFIKAANIVSRAKLSSWYDVILDNPYETEAENLRTIDILLSMPRPFQLSLFSLDFFPGTELRRRALEDKIPIPEPGAKSYTEPENKMINRYIRMSATLPSGLTRLLVRTRKTIPGKVAGMGFYAISMLLEPFVYLWLIHKSNDFNILRTMRVVKAFYLTAINKLLLRK